MKKHWIAALAALAIVVPMIGHAKANEKCEKIAEWFFDIPLSKRAVELSISTTIDQAVRRLLASSGNNPDWKEGEPHWERAYDLYAPVLAQEAILSVREAMNIEKERFAALMDASRCNKYADLVKNNTGLIEVKEADYAGAIEMLKESEEKSSSKTKRMVEDLKHQTKIAEIELVERKSKGDIYGGMSKEEYQDFCRDFEGFSDKLSINDLGHLEEVLTDHLGAKLGRIIEEQMPKVNKIIEEFNRTQE
ncbi:hypothetical protein [Chitinolyticbacter meiyuanensis]|uniref:hypothetical protein n=1 Tax=Chitinolyticbacter meiyuanensis TaxID=682798 RepID=UPI0011E5F032|nr:hypothetical protein [Chitinolyticbacter meiyuanensis]